MTPQGVLETALYADDLDAAEAFYGDVLELEPESRVPGRHVFFRCGRGMVLIFDPRASAIVPGFVPPHGATGPGHVAFAVDESELGAWEQQLERHGVEIEARVDWPAGGRSLYFRDPAGNSLELATPRIWGLEESLPRIESARCRGRRSVCR